MSSSKKKSKKKCSRSQEFESALRDLSEQAPQRGGAVAGGIRLGTGGEAEGALVQVPDIQAVDERIYRKNHLPDLSLPEHADTLWSIQESVETHKAYLPGKVKQSWARVINDLYDPVSGVLRDYERPTGKTACKNWRDKYFKYIRKITDDVFVKKAHAVSVGRAYTSSPCESRSLEHLRKFGAACVASQLKADENKREKADTQKVNADVENRANLGPAEPLGTVSKSRIDGSDPKGNRHVDYVNLLDVEGKLTAQLQGEVGSVLKRLDGGVGYSGSGESNHDRRKRAKLQNLKLEFETKAAARAAGEVDTSFLDAVIKADKADFALTCATSDGKENERPQEDEPAGTRIVDGKIVRPDDEDGMTAGATAAGGGGVPVGAAAGGGGVPVGAVAAAAAGEGGAPVGAAAAAGGGGVPVGAAAVAGGGGVRSQDAPDSDSGSDSNGLFDPNRPKKLMLRRDDVVSYCSSSASALDVSAKNVVIKGFRTNGNGERMPTFDTEELPPSTESFFSKLGLKDSKGEPYWFSYEELDMPGSQDETPQESSKRAASAARRRRAHGSEMNKSFEEAIDSFWASQSSSK